MEQARFINDFLLRNLVSAFLVSIRFHHTAKICLHDLLLKAYHESIKLNFLPITLTIRHTLFQDGASNFCLNIKKIWSKSYGIVGKAYDQGKKIENSAFAVDPALTTSLTSPTFTSSAAIPLYRCKKCRRIIACRDNVLSHDEDSKNSPFKKKERDVAWNQKDEMKCTSIFVEPMQWMSTGRFYHNMVLCKA
jgi:hypothetical protein